MDKFCSLCNKEVCNICTECGLGTMNPSTINKFVGAKCPNKHTYHSKCLCNWSIYDSYCIICEEELLEETCSQCHSSIEGSW